MSLIIQLYFLFPYLQRLLTNIGERRFLLLSALFSILFLRVFSNMWILAGVFFGCWLLEFSIGMVMANHYSKISSTLGAKTIVPLFTGYILGLYLSSSPLTWPLGRPLYGITLTLFLWSLYNIIKNVNQRSSRRSPILFTPDLMMMCVIRSFFSIILWYGSCAILFLIFYIMILFKLIILKSMYRKMSDL